MVSVITSYVPASSTAKLYTLISAIEELSRLIGSPLVQAAWSQGIAWGGQFIGFPFFILAVRLTLSLSTAEIVNWALDVSLRPFPQGRNHSLCPSPSVNETSSRLFSVSEQLPHCLCRGQHWEKPEPKRSIHDCCKATTKRMLKKLTTMLTREARLKSVILYHRSKVLLGFTRPICEACSGANNLRSIEIISPYY